MKPTDSEYEVGYGKPPQDSRFAKGVSGNPNGRPKGKLNIATVLARILEEPVVINENGERKTITKFEAAFKQVANKSISGDLKATKLLIALVHYIEEHQQSQPAPDPVLSSADQKVAHGVLQRMLQAYENKKGESDADIQG
jgi:hypothetical protein